MVNRVVNHETAADHKKPKGLIGAAVFKGKSKEKKYIKLIRPLKPHNNVHSHVINSSGLFIYGQIL